MKYDELIKIPNPHPWEPDQIRIGPKRLSIRRANPNWDDKCYFSFEKKRQGLFPPTLEIEVREVNQRKGRNQPPYHYEAISLPWEVAERLAEFLQAGPWKTRASRKRPALDVKKELARAAPGADELNRSLTRQFRYPE